MRPSKLSVNSLLGFPLSIRAIGIVPSVPQRLLEFADALSKTLLVQRRRPASFLVNQTLSPIAVVVLSRAVDIRIECRLCCILRESFHELQSSLFGIREPAFLLATGWQLYAKKSIFVSPRNPIKRLEVPNPSSEQFIYLLGCGLEFLYGWLVHSKVGYLFCRSQLVLLQQDWRMRSILLLVS